MAQNIEIKAKATNFETQLTLGEQLSDTPLRVLHQQDTFFHVQEGRLKLREFADAPAQLIFYTRPDQSGPKLSDYHIAQVECPASLKTVLSKAHGVQAVVNKERKLYMHGRTRLHFDAVAQLGHFIELEVVLNAQESQDAGMAEAERLMDALKIEQQDLINVAYVDLLNGSGEPNN